MKKILISLFFIHTVLFSSTIRGEDKLVLIGIDSYQNGLPPLAGVSQDIKMMEQAGQILGFKSSQIINLIGQDATLSAVRQLMFDLTQSTSPGDRLIVYFSGHGSQIQDENHDEEDFADEVLLLSDSVIIEQNGEQSLENVLIDDELRIMLESINSKQIIVLIDACHSGTMHKAFSIGEYNSTIQDKYFRYNFSPVNYSGSIVKGFNWLPEKDDMNRYHDNNSIENYIVLSASHDDEPAISTQNGSLFTRGVLAVLQKYQQENRTLSLAELQILIDAFIKKTVTDENLHINHSPQLHGSTKLFDYVLLKNNKKNDHFSNGRDKSIKIDLNNL